MSDPSSGCEHEWVLAETYLSMAGADRGFVCSRCSAVSYRQAAGRSGRRTALPDLPDHVNGLD